MKRQEKYPETASFIYHNQNPKHRITGDCCFRAMSLGLDQDYNETVREMAETMCKTSYTLDECPMAYKNINDIINNIKETVVIDKIIKPIYNFKAGETL